MKTFLTFLLLIILLSVLSAQENGGPYTTDQNTVLLMHFDDDATNSANVGNDGIEHGSGVSYEEGIHGQALRLDNSTADKQSWIEVPYFEGLNATSDGLAVECWFKLNSYDSNDGSTKSLFRKDGESWKADYEIILWPQGNEGRHGQVNLDCVDEESQDWGADASIADILELNTWYYIVLYYNPYFIHEYVNDEGEQRQASSVYCLIRDENFEEIFASRGHTESPATNSEGLFRIGFGGSDDSYFDGWIDELRISNSYRKYRDDVLANVDTNTFPDSVFLPLKDNWTSYGWPLGELYPVNNETGEIYRYNNCGPTMITRTLHYWEHPRFPSGEIEHNYRDCNWHANYDSTEYLWDLMPESFKPGATEEIYGPAALLSLQVGVVQVLYDMYGMPKFLKENFHYSEKTRVVFEEEYTKEEWENIIRNELSNGRICMVGGWGHYYIINGYNSKNQFFTDYSFNDLYWNDIKDFDYGAMQDMIIYFEPDWGDKELELVSPSKNKTYKAGSQIEIQWTSKNISNVIIEYTNDNGKNWHTISGNANASAGTFTWNTPNDDSKKYKIRISDTENLNVYRKSETFEIYSQKEFTFEYPIQNSAFKKATHQPIYWQSKGINNIKIEYSFDNQNWISLGDSINGTAGFTYIDFPNIVSEDVVLRATDLADNQKKFTSEKFNLVSNQLNGGPYTKDDNTLLLMHFENNLDNDAGNNLYAVEGGLIGEYADNYELNLGKAFKMDNGPGSPASDHLWIYNSENLDLGNNWTIETWVNIKSIGDDKTGYFPIIIEKAEMFGVYIIQDGGNNANGFHAFVNFKNDEGVVFYQNQKLNLNQWYHVSLISDAASKTVNLYIHDENRNLIYEGFQSFPEGSNGELKENQNRIMIGGIGGASNRQLDGWLDELIVTKSSNLVDYIQTIELPLFDDFEENINQDATFTKWTTQNLEGWHYWHLVSGQGVNYSQCMRFENNDADQDDWLITKALNCSGANQLNINFDVLFNGTGVKPQLFYKSLNKENNTSSDWTELNYSLGSVENEWHSVDKITINDPGDIIYFAFHSEQAANQGVYFLLDNFSVESITTDVEVWSEMENNFLIYPNPVTSESVISFHTKTSGKVNLSIFDIQGRKIATLLNKKLNVGIHTIPVSNSLLSNGIYFCKLQTSEGISIKKLVLNAN